MHLLAISLKKPEQRDGETCDALGCSAKRAPLMDMSEYVGALREGWWAGQMLRRRQGGLYVSAHCCQACADRDQEASRDASKRSDALHLFAYGGIEAVPRDLRPYLR